MRVRERRKKMFLLLLECRSGGGPDPQPSRDSVFRLKFRVSPGQC